MDFDYTKNFIDEVKGALKRPGSSGGKDGFSPTVKENPSNTDNDYRLDITDKNRTFTTPNLKGKEGKTPTITIEANNNWFVNGVDTGVKAKGEKGDTGSGFNTTRQYSSVSDMMADTDPANDSEIVVVVLGDIGNFYMRLSSYIDPDGETNGYLPIGSAQDISTIKGDPGVDGADGITPHIDPATKRWFLGTTDTGVKAEGKDGKDGKDGVNGVDGTDGIDGTNVTVAEFSGNNGGIYKLVIQDVNGQIITPNLLGINGGGDTPVGHILSYMGITAPEHYLVCDGAVYNIRDYPELANHFRREFGSSNFFGGNGKTTFAVPDLRGEFLRGAGTNSHANQGSGSKVGKHQDATEHLNFGVNTTDKSIWFDTSTPKSGTTQVSIGKTDSDLKLTTGDNTKGLYGNLTQWSTSSNYSHYTSRPTNTAVLYCIKCESTEQKDTYSTNEIKVGTWVDGKPVYRKVIEGVTSDTPDTGYVISSIKDMETLVSYTGSILDNNSVKHKIGTYLGGEYNSVLYVDTSGNVYMRHGSAMVNKSYSLIIEYTKTTDV